MKTDRIQKLKNAKRRADLRDADKVESELSEPPADTSARTPQAERDAVAARRLVRLGGTP